MRPPNGRNSTEDSRPPATASDHSPHYWSCRRYYRYYGRQVPRYPIQPPKSSRQRPRESSLYAPYRLYVPPSNQKTECVIGRGPELHRNARHYWWQFTIRLGQPSEHRGPDLSPSVFASQNYVKRHARKKPSLEKKDPVHSNLLNPIPLPSLPPRFRLDQPLFPPSRNKMVDSGKMVDAPAQSRVAPVSKPAQAQAQSKPTKVHYPFWFGGSASCFAASVTHPLDLGMCLYLSR